MKRFVCSLMMLLLAIIAEARPNIIFIMADDLGAEAVSAYGSDTYQTPNVDALARSGMRFTQAFAQPMCSPTRVQTITGKYLFRNYSRWGTLHDGERTIAHVLQQAGYATLTVGKWQLGAAGGQRPQDAGFDNFFTWESNYGSRYWAPVFNDNGQMRQYGSNIFGPDVLTDYLNEWIAHHRAGPFFIFYSELLPHNPTVVPPGSDADTQQEKVIDMWEYGDKMVGKILAQLNKLGLREETLVLFTADNGSSAQVKNVRVMTEHGSQIVTGGKGKTTPAGTWVPFIVSWPGHIKAGHVSDAVIDSLTIFPTLADVGEADRPTDLDSESILPILLGQQSTTQGWSYTWYDPLRPQGNGFNDFAGEYIQDGRWKLYRWHNCSQHDWLFDLHTDWKEQRPIASGGTAEQREARARLASLMRKVKPKNTQPVSCSRGTKE